MTAHSAATDSKSIDTRRNSSSKASPAHAPLAPAAVPGNRATLRLMRKCACGGGPDCDCDMGPNKHRKTDLHRSATRSSGGPGEAPPIVHDVLRSPGTALDPGTRSFFESRFGRDFGAVRVHTDSRAAESARAVQAHAYAVGNDIAFAAGRYAPATDAGKGLLAHELAHTLQQPSSAGQSHRQGLAIGAVNDPLEADADRTANSVMSAAAAPVATTRRESTHTIRRYVESTEPSTAFGELALGLSSVISVASTRSLAETKSCFDPLFPPMNQLTSRWVGDACSRAPDKFVHNRAFDAFGHCWVACEGTRRCGGFATRIAGTAREFVREWERIKGIRPHDSFTQDLANQALGRELASTPGTCYSLCDAAYSAGRMDLSAPDATCYDCTTGAFNQPCPPAGPTGQADPEPSDVPEDANA